MNPMTKTLSLSLLLLTTACSQHPEKSFITDEGFTSIDHHRFTTLLIRPDSPFHQYTKIIIEPATVSYDHRHRNDSLHRRSSDFEFDDKELLKFNSQIAKALSAQWKKDWGWELTKKPGKNVIRARLTITELYFFASIKNKQLIPDVTFTNESSRMKINLNLYDSLSDLTLLKSSGIKTTGFPGTSIHTLTPFSSIKYWNETYQAFRQWAQLLSSQIKQKQAE